VPISTASSAGRRHASGNQGSTPKPRDLGVAVVEEARVAAELVDEEAPDQRGVGRVDDRLRADDLRDHPAAVDVAGQHDGNVGGAREAHVGDVARAQVDLGRAARALDHHQIKGGAQAGETLEHGVHEPGPERAVIPRARRRHAPALHHHLRAGVGFGLQQHRVHVGDRVQPAGQRLQRLRAPDLAAVGGHGGVVRHVLRLEGRDRQPPPPRRAAEPGDQHRLADVGAGALQHERAGHALRPPRPLAPRHPDP
jgi:hypothetical protein